MDRYQRVERPRADSAIGDNEIRVTTQGLIRNYISYATTLLQEKRAREIVLKGMGQAISKTVAIAEILKKRTPGLHQDTSISSVSITDVWEPIEEGLVPLEMTRHVSMISIALSTRELDKNSPGYQAPIHFEQPRRQQRMQQPQHYQQQQQFQPRQIQNQVFDDSYGRERGRGRGRGGWARGGYEVYEGYRGGYGGYGGYGGGYGGGYNNYQDNGWSWNGGRGGRGGRGRGGWNYHGAGYERGRGGPGVGRGYGRGRGRMGGRGRGIQVE